jgi:hypothetical protein
MRIQGRYALILLVATLLALLSCAACNREKTVEVEEVTPESEEGQMPTSDLDSMGTDLASMSTELGSIEPTPINDDSGSADVVTQGGRPKSPPPPPPTDVFACTCNTYQNGVPVSSRQISRGEWCGGEVCR